MHHVSDQYTLSEIRNALKNWARVPKLREQSPAGANRILGACSRLLKQSPAGAKNVNYILISSIIHGFISDKVYCV